MVSCLRMEVVHPDNSQPANIRMFTQLVRLQRTIESE
jgi:hypothetical protein